MNIILIMVCYLWKTEFCFNTCLIYLETFKTGLDYNFENLNF